MLNKYSVKSVYTSLLKYLLEQRQSKYYNLTEPKFYYTYLNLLQNGIW